MTFNPDEETKKRYVDHTSPIPKITVRQKIEHFLRDGRWHSLQDIQDNVRGSSVRSRLQDIMKDDREYPSGYYKDEEYRNYQEKWIKHHNGSGRCKMYRFKCDNPQDTLFDLPPVKDERW
jgi:hypothetical protein